MWLNLVKSIFSVEHQATVKSPMERFCICQFEDDSMCFLEIHHPACNMSHFRGFFKRSFVNLVKHQPIEFMFYLFLLNTGGDWVSENLNTCLK